MSPVVKFDVSGSDPDKAKGFVQPPPGVYPAKITECKPGFKKGDDNKPDKSAPRLEVIATISAGKYKGAPLYDYLSFSEAAQWRLDQFLQVFGISDAKKRKGQFKTEDVVGLPCQIKVKGETYNGEYSAKVGAYLEADDDAILDDEDEELDDEEEEEIEEEEEVEEEEEEEGESYSEEDLNGMSLDDLNTILEGLGVEKPKTVKGKAGKVARILELQGESEEDEEEEEEEEETDDYDDMSIPDLKTAVKARGLKVLKTDDDESLKAKLREDDNSDPFAG